MPNVSRFDSSKGGGGFREIARYLLQPHSEQTKTDIAGGWLAPERAGNRVALWTLREFGQQWEQNEAPPIEHTAIADSVARTMQDTVDRADELKRAAGISTRGRKATTEPWYSVSFRDHPDAIQMDDQRMMAFIERALRDGLGLPEGHQMLIVKHVEPGRPHNPDWHVLVNKVNARDGTRWNPMNDQQKLQTFCDDHDHSRGYDFTPDRRAKKDRARKWAQQSKDPKQRDRSAPKPQPKKRYDKHHPAMKCIAEIERRGLPVTGQIASLIEKQMQRDRRTWQTLGPRVVQRHARAQEKREKGESWQKLKADKEAAQNVATTMRGRLYKLRHKAEWGRYGRRAAAKRQKLDDRIKARYRNFYQQEKTAFGAAKNAAAIVLECRRRGMAGPTLMALIQSPLQRRQMMAQFADRDRNALKRELTQEREKLTDKLQAASPMKAARDKAWQEHRDRIAAAESSAQQRIEDAATQRAAANKEAKAEYDRIIGLAQRERQEIEERAEQIIGPSAATAEEIMESTRKAAVRLQMREAMKNTDRATDRGRERSIDRNRPGRGR